MSIISVGIDGGLSAELNERWEPSYSVTYKVLSNSPWDGPAAIVNGLANYNIGIGKPYDLRLLGLPFEYDLSALCKSISPKLTTQGASYLWDVTAEFGIWNPFEYVENPLDAPVLPVIEPVVREVFISKDLDGKAICNTAGDPYTDVKFELHNFLFRFSKNYATLPFDILQSQGAINNATWQGCEPFSVKFNSCRCEQLPSSFLKSTYYKLDFEFELNNMFLESGNDNASDPTNTDGNDENPATTGKPIGWLLVVLNAGIYQLQSSQLVPAIVGGQPATSPVPLDANGAQITNPTEANIVFNTFHVFRELDFNSTFADFPSDLFAVQAYPSQT